MPVKNVNDLKCESVYTAFFLVHKETDTYKNETQLLFTYLRNS